MSSEPPSAGQDEHCGVARRGGLDKLMLRLSEVLISAEPGKLHEAFAASLAVVGAAAGVDRCFMFELDASLHTASMIQEWTGPGVKAARESFAGVTRESLPTLFARAAAGQTLRVDALAEGWVETDGPESLIRVDAQQPKGNEDRSAAADQTTSNPDAGRELAWLSTWGVSAFMLQPIVADDRVIGLLGVSQQQRPRRWSEMESRLLKRASALIAPALQRRRTQDRLAFHLDNVPLAVIEWNAQWRVQQWSPQAERMFGWSASDVVGRAWDEWPFVPDDERANITEVARALMSGNGSANQSINRNLTADGRVITCNWFNSVMRDAAGASVSILSFVQDITESVAVSERLSAREAELQRLHAELRARASEAMRESELRYGYLAEAATDLISCHDAEGRYLYASPAAEGLLGYRPEQLVGRGAYELIHPDDTAAVQENHGQLLATGQGDALTYRLRHCRGHYVWVETSSRLIDPADVDGGADASISQPSQIVAVTRDATARLQAELALRDSERRYRQLAEHATDLISTHDAAGRFTYVSPAAFRLLGYTNEDLRGTRPRNLAHPEDRAKVIDSLRRLRENAGVVSTTFRARHRQGHYIWLESSSHHDSQEITVVSRDVTDRLRAEEQLHLIQQAVDQVRESVIITDNRLQRPGPHILYVNPAFTSLTGYRAADILGKSPRVLQGPRTDQAVIERLRVCLRDGQPFFGQTVNYRRDGSEYFVEWHINPVTDPQGNLTHWVAIQRDITARKTAEELARLHRDELAHATRVSAIGEMASGLAHELNQPLAAITSYIQGSLHRIEHSDAPARELVDPLQRAAEQAGRAGEIIRGIRAFVTKRGAKRRTHHLPDLIARTLTLLEADIRTQQTTIQLQTRDQPPPVYVDGIQIEQILFNLIRNALEAMEALPVERRRLDITTLVPEPGQVQVSLRDHGPGLAPAQLDRLFHPFFSTKDGMGMGLTISQSIAQAHHGRLHAAPHPEGGLIFHLTLPTQQSQNPPSEVD